jgi:hypothetical protein
MNTLRPNIVPNYEFAKTITAEKHPYKCAPFGSIDFNLVTSLYEHLSNTTSSSMATTCIKDIKVAIVLSCSVTYSEQ